MSALKTLFWNVKTRDRKASLSFTKAPTEDKLFEVTNEAVDGPECLQDCSTCTIKYPAKFSIDETEKLYGHVKGWSTHLIVGTGKSDWVRDVADEKGSVMEAVDKGDVKAVNGKLMLSASNMPRPDHCDYPNNTHETPSTVLLLPAFTLIDNVTPSTVPDLITHFVNAGPTNTTPLAHNSIPALPVDSPLRSRPCPHDYLILLCSQKTRDARCGQSAPLLRREFERHLRPLGMYRDLTDERPGGVGIYFISHVGGHKFSANVMIYRRAGMGRESVHERKTSVVEEENAGTATSENGVKAVPAVTMGEDDPSVETPAVVEASREAGQCIWLARVRPEDCENIIRYTVLQGKVVKPQSQLRGGFDRERQLTSW
ncbi:hypothetical protein EJ05DRAFT_540840 [Pseudovirgaria hyperparasitica]|uniref:Sucrase/ferredoxin-like family protein n=1 Tax=Pseudovirgaria hyperparasitica TaxID=470096 RepID=A0A6A6VX67_9PEZI|nr:uncharacterized protein EJ05DRAFT_540840 [Pseudovirgaria hyperparasitica]KAF2754775.1 hypothetical protein EJ05DRAFT_540840 [Pseudovirgaria hyperparasitica]